MKSSVDSNDYQEIIENKTVTNLWFLSEPLAPMQKRTAIFFLIHLNKFSVNKILIYIQQINSFINYHNNLAYPVILA